jgi:hypothetical protein
VAAPVVDQQKVDLVVQETHHQLLHPREIMEEVRLTLPVKRAVVVVGLQRLAAMCQEIRQEI